ncbi:hypothetical protein AAH979_37995 [Plantactinospora sp. ZYX-F-223]|uniref:hypothetical protein n=1 Tax=Plantactinospora sp. ZYX-F-223 TaxID=3144103 RepID=UPI0031FBB5A5
MLAWRELPCGAVGPDGGAFRAGAVDEECGETARQHRGPRGRSQHQLGDSESQPGPFGAGEGGDGETAEPDDGPASRGVCEDAAGGGEHHRFGDGVPGDNGQSEDVVSAQGARRA